MRTALILFVLRLASAASAQIGPAWKPFMPIQDPQARSQVVTALSSDWNPNSSKIIVAALMDPSPNVVKTAREALRSHKSPQVFDQLIAGMVEGSQYEAALLLADYTEHRYVRAMVRQLRNPSINVRRPIAMALGLIHDPMAYQPLRQALRDPDPGYHGEVERALARFGPKNAP